MTTKGNSGGKKRGREASLASVIKAAFSSKNKKLRERAADNLRSRGIEVEYMEESAAA